MKREIKFRATLKGKIVAYIRITPDQDGLLHTSWNTTNEGGWIFSTTPKHDHLDQYTGLHDKNGKEIYEGDVVKGQFQGYNPRKDATDLHEKMCGVMEITEYGPQFKIVQHLSDPVEKRHNKVNYFYLQEHEAYDSWFEDREVIGNIYEHPHLLSN